MTHQSVFSIRLLQTENLHYQYRQIQKYRSFYSNIDSGNDINHIDCFDWLLTGLALAHRSQSNYHLRLL